MIAVMEGEPSLPRSSDPFTAGCIGGCISPSDGAGEAVAAPVGSADPGIAEPEDHLTDAERMLHGCALDDVSERAQPFLLGPQAGLQLHGAVGVDAPAGSIERGLRIEPVVGKTA